MNRDELIEVGARALFDEGEEGPSVEAEERREGCRTLAEEVIDAVEPLIRTDEAKRMNHRWRTQVLDNERDRMRLDILADLRAKVEALPHYERGFGRGGAVWRSNVLDLIDGGHDGQA